MGLLQGQLIASLSAALAVFIKKRQPASVSAGAEFVEKCVEAHGADREKGGGSSGGSDVSDSRTVTTVGGSGAGSCGIVDIMAC